MHVFFIDPIFGSRFIEHCDVPPENSCVLPERDPLVNAALYLGGNVDTYSGIAVVTFENFELLERFYEFSLRYRAICCSTLDNLFFSEITLNSVFYSTNKSDAIISHKDMIASNSPFASLDTADTKLQELFGIVTRISRDRELCDDFQLCRALSEDIDVLVKVLKNCNLLIDLGESVFGNCGIVKLPDRTMSTLLFCYPVLYLKWTDRHKNIMRWIYSDILEYFKTQPITEVYNKICKCRNSVSHDLFFKPSGLNHQCIAYSFEYLAKLAVLCLDLYLYSYKHVRLLEILLEFIPKSDKLSRKALISNAIPHIFLCSVDFLADIFEPN